MKKIIKNMIIGYTLGVTILFFTYVLEEILGEILSQTPSKEYILSTLILLLHTVVFGICIGTGITIGEKNKEKLKDNNIKEKILRDSITSIIIIITFIAISLTVFIIKGLDIGFVIMIALIIVALGMWGIGAYLGYKNLRKQNNKK